MRARGRDLQEVVLVEESEAIVGGAGELSDADASSGNVVGRSPGRGLQMWLVRTGAAWSLIAAGLAIVVGTSHLFVAEQERERMAALAGVPGILRPLDGPVTELWRLGTDTDAMYINGSRGFGGRLLLTEYSIDGAVDVVAVDARTGAQDWRVQALPAQEMAIDAVGTSTSGNGANCAFPGSQDAKHSSVVACVVTDESTAVPSGDDGGVMVVGTRAHLLVLDATTGAILSQSPTDPTSSVALVGADLITGQFAADGRVVVTRSGARDRTPLRSFTSPDPVSTDVPGQRNVWVSASEGFIVVGSYGATGDDGRPLGGSNWVLSRDGTVVRHLVDDSGEGYQGLGVLPGGMVVETTTSATGALGSVLTDAVTGTTITVEATPMGASPDDGSLGDAFLMSGTGGTLLAYDLTTQRARWTGATSANGGYPMVVGGRVVRSASDGTSSVRITSVDARTGETVWSTSLTSDQSGSLVTDGRLVILSRSDPSPGLGSVMTALDLTDGRQRWEVPIDDGQWLVEIDGRLFGQSGLGLVAYGQP